MLIVSETLCPQPKAEELRNKERDKLTLTWEQRRWLRGRFITASGREIALALPTGTKLKPGEIIVLGPDYFIEIEAALEKVIVVDVPEREMALRVAYEVGNRHFPLASNATEILVPDDPAMRNLMERLGMTLRVELRPFDPITTGKLQGHDH